MPIVRKLRKQKITHLKCHKLGKLTAGVQPRWSQGFQRGDGFGNQDTIELKI